MKKVIFAILILVIIFGLIQLIPYGRNHNNPAVVSEPIWDSPATRKLAKIACFDCHSNETIWPWYSNIAPVSWMIYRDVMVGRSRLNFSEWTNQQQDLGEISEAIQEGEMPPFQYTIIHWNANLNKTQKSIFIQGITDTIK